MPLQEGDAVPEFDLPATTIPKLDSSQLLPLAVVYFFPRANTSGCNREGQDFQNALAQLKCTVVGISRDPLPTLQRFATKFDLRFPLASDLDGAVADAFGVWGRKLLYGREYMGVERSTFLIEHGRIKHIWRKVKVPGHVDAVVQAVRQTARA